MPHLPDDGTPASSSATGSQDRGTSVPQSSPITDGSRYGLPPKSVYIVPTITRTDDSFKFGSGVMTNWPPLYAIAGIRDCISALPSFTINNVDALSPKELMAQQMLMMSEIGESGRASLKAFADRIEEHDPHVSIFYVNDAVSVNCSQAPQPTTPTVSQHGSQNATERGQNDETGRPGDSGP